MKKLKVYIIFVLLIVLAACKTSAVNKNEPGNLKTSNSVPVPGKWSERMAASILKRNPWMGETTGASWGYTQGVIYYAFEQLWRKTNNRQYLDYIKLYADQMIDDNGDIKGFKREDFNLDNINAGKVLFNLYATTHNEKYKKAIGKLRDQLREQPRTSQGGYWHKQKYASQMWLDGVYMASPFLAAYARTFGDDKAFDEVALQFILMNEHMRDAKTGLLYHGWDESKRMIWANKQTGTSPHFWGRAVGWYMMAIVDALASFPKDHPRRNELINIFGDIASSVVNFQDASTGLWYQVLDQGSRKGNYLEASASSMFVYAIAKGVSNGYLDKKYMNAATKGYDGLIKQLVKVKENGEVDLLQVCEVAGLSADRDGSYDYYVNEKIRVNDPKGTGPFILASLELNR